MSDDAAAATATVAATTTDAGVGEKRKAAADDEAAAEQQEPKKAKQQTHMCSISNVVDKEHRAKSLNEIIALPVAALNGIGDHGQQMWEAFKVHTIGDLAKWKFFHAARAISTLAASEKGAKGANARVEGSTVNIAGIVDKEHEHKSFTDLAKAPPSALKGLAPWTDSALKAAKIKTIKQLGEYRFCIIAEALVAAAAFEHNEHSSSSGAAAAAAGTHATNE